MMCFIANQNQEYLSVIAIECQVATHAATDAKFYETVLQIINIAKWYRNFNESYSGWKYWEWAITKHQSL